MRALVGFAAAFLSALLAFASPASAAVTERSVFYRYDAMGREVSAKFDSATGADGIASSYNGFGDLKSTTLTMGSFSKTIGSTYDGAGRRTQVTHPDAQAFTYAYDALGRLTNVYEGAGTTTPLDAFTYTNAGFPGTRSEGVSGASNVTYSWDDIGRLTSQSDAFAAPASNVGWTFSINPASQITAEARTNDAYAYAGVVTVSRAYAINGLNQYTSAGSASFTYDANGNLTSDGSTTYTYDVENRLVTAVGGGTTTSLTYDPSGRLFEVVKGSADTRFLYDGDALIAEYDASGAVTNRYVHGSNAAADDPLVWYAGANLSSRQFLHADHLGSIIAVTNCNAGAECINAYDEYGVPQTDAATHTTNLNQGRFQYTGQAWLPELGMYYYKARIYSPTLGRFLQTDPIGYKDQINLYEYVGNDPVDGSDPSGECPECIGFVVGVGLEAANQYIATGSVDLSGGGLAKLGVAGLVGASGVGIGGQVAKLTASFTARAALNAAAGAALGAAQTGANAKIDGKPIRAGEVVKGAALGGAAGAAGSAVADAAKGGARVLAEQTGINIVTRAGQVATPTASSSRDSVVRSAANIAGNAAQALPGAADAARQRLNCFDPSKCR